MKKLVVLENVRVATPCNAAWDEMAGDDQVRFCGQCEKNVYNLSAMTRAEAEARAGSGDEMCVRLYRRSDGTVLTSDCPVGVRRMRFRQRIWAALSAAALFVGLLGRARGDASLPKDRPKVVRTHKITITAGQMVVMATVPSPQPRALPKPPIEKVKKIDFKDDDFEMGDMVVDC